MNILRAALATGSAACILLAIDTARAGDAVTVLFCDVVQDSSGSRYPRNHHHGCGQGIIPHLKTIWLDGDASRFNTADEQFVTIAKDDLKWGRRHRAGGVEDLFTLDLATEQYAWWVANGTQLADGACRLPALAS